MSRFQSQWWRITGVLVLLMLAVPVLTGCDNDSDDDQTPTSTTSIPTQSPTPSVSPTPSPSPTPSAGTAPPEVAQHSTDWPLANKDYANTRSTKDSTINSGNVSTLGAAWVHNVPSGQSSFGSISTNPIIMGNDVYIQDIGNNTFVLDLATGRQKWETVYNLANLGPNGASVGYGKVFVSAGPHDVAALDANTGQELWRTTLIDIGKNPSQGVNGIDMQTTVYDGLVYISTVPGNAGVFYAGGGMGVIYALDQATGKIVWSFNTIQDTNLWGHPEINSGGGCWYTPAIDTETGAAYFAIANPAPFPGQPQASGIPQDYPNGTSRSGPNLYTNSILAVDHSTGQLQWYSQVWPHDISDYDLQIPPILAPDVTYAGVKQDVILAAGKMGRVYAMNSGSGCILWTTAVGEHNGNDELAAWPLDDTITVLPGILGGVETPMAYTDGTVYVLANNLATDYTNGLTLNLHPFSQNTSDLVAIDVSTGHILWNVPFQSGGYGGTTVVNDLVFTGTFDGMLYAFKRDTGQQVWSYQAPAAVNAWPAVAGDTIVWPLAGPGTPSVIGFKLRATAPAIKFVSPLDGAHLPAGDLAVTIEASNFKVVETRQTNVPGEGRIHIFLDVDAPTTPGQPAIPPGGIWARVESGSYTFTNVAAGMHTISVELVNNDQTPLNPPVVQKIAVTTDTNPRISISSPTNGSIKKAGSITIQVNTTNFNVMDKQGQAAAPGEGHVHFYMDVVPPNAPGQPAIPAGGVWAHVADTSFIFENVPIGLHTFYVQLVNNDHTPLSPNVTDSIQIFAITYTGGFGSQ